MNRKHGAFSTIEISDELSGYVIPLVGKHISHFTSVEDRFFTEGEALSTGSERPGTPDDMTTTRPSRRWLTRNRSLVGGTIGALVIASTVLLVRSGGHAADIAETQPTIAAAPPPAVPAPAAAAVPARSPAPSPSPTAHPSELLPAPAPTDLGGSPSPAHASAGAGADFSTRNALQSCKKAFDQHRSKDVLVKCAEAFATDPQSVDTAVMLAKTEFDRGRAPQALDWAKKAIALDANTADAYVFLGGAEQAAGHNAAAKTAYKRYLQLSPQGRYAGDLRAVLGTL